VSYGLPVQDVDFVTVKTVPLHRILTGSKNLSFYTYTSLVLDGSANLIHSWNLIPVSKAPFVVSFENELPRYLGGVSERRKELGCKLLASNRCRAILALSEAAKGVAIRRFTEKGYGTIADKIMVFRGGIASVDPVEKYAFGVTRKVLKLLFVGVSSIPKGVVPSLCAIKRLADEGCLIELHFIGNLQGKDGSVLRGHKSLNDKILDECRGLPWFKDYGLLAHSEVLKLMKESDILLFPSLAESLGWVTTEASMAGIPSIVTNVFAFPELVDHDKTGFIIDLELNEKEKRWIGIDSTCEKLGEHVERAYSRIEQSMYEIIKKVYNDFRIIEEFGRAAHDKINDMYNRQNAAEQLKCIYHSAIKN